MPRVTDDIDTILETLFAADAQGYQLLDAKVMKSAAVERIQRTIAKMEKPKRKTVENEAAYRLEQFERFRHLGEEQREEILRLAKERHISIEEAYKLASAE